MISDSYNTEFWLLVVATVNKHIYPEYSSFS